MRKSGLILQLKIDRKFAGSRTGQFPFADEPLIAQRSQFVHAEVSVDRIDTDDSGESSGISLYQVAYIHQLMAAPSVEWRGNVSKFKIQLSRIAGCLRRDHLRRGLILVRHCRIVVFFRDDSCLSQTLLALERRILQLLIGLRLLQLSKRLFVSILIRSGIDLKEQIAFVDNVAFLKRNIHNVTADSRRYVHQLDFCRSAGELVPIHYLFLLRLAHSDLRGWGARRHRLLVVTACEPKTERDDNQALTAVVLFIHDQFSFRKREPSFINTSLLKMVFFLFPIGVIVVRTV